MCVHIHVCLCLYFKVVALKNHSCSKFLNTGKLPFSLNGGGLVEMHMLVLAQGPFEALGSNRKILLLTERPF